MTTQMPQLRNKISISAGNTNRALRDIISPTSIGSYVESVEALKYGFYNTKISIMVDNWINGVQANGLAERFTRRVIVYNRVNLATVIPAGAVVPTTSVAAAVAVLNSKYRLDLTEDDVEIKDGKITAKETSLGYYDEQETATGKTCASDRLNFFFSLAVKRNDINEPQWVEGFIENFYVTIDGDEIEVNINNLNNPGYNNRIKRAVLGLQEFFAGRSDIEMLVNFDTYGFVSNRGFEGPSGDINLIPNITLVNKTTREIEIGIRYKEHESLSTGLLPNTLLKPMGSVLPSCPISHRVFITIPDVNGDSGFFNDLRIKTIKINNATYENIEQTVNSTWELGAPIFSDLASRYTAKLSRVFDVLGINNLLRIYANSSFKRLDYNNEQVPTFMIENITSEVVVIEFETVGGDKYKLELAGDPRKDEPWFRRSLVSVNPNTMYNVIFGSYSGSGGVSTKVNGVEIDNDFSVPWRDEIFKYIVYGDFLAANKIEVNLWEDVTSKGNSITVVTVENKDIVAKTFEASFPMDESNQSDGFKYLIPFMNLGVNGTVGVDLLYNIINDDIQSRIKSDDFFLTFNKYHFSFDGIDIPESELPVDEPSSVSFAATKLGPGMMMQVIRGESVLGDPTRPYRAHFIGELPQAQQIYTRARGGDGGYTSPLNVISPIDINPVVYPSVWLGLSSSIEPIG